MPRLQELLVPQFLALIAKDIRLVGGSGQGVAQAALLGLLLVFVFSLARQSGAPVPEQWVAAIFWLASAFSLILIFNTLFSLEEDNNARTGLLLSPLSPQAIWAAKALGGGVLLLMVQCILYPALVVFLGAPPITDVLPALGVLFAVNWGLVVLGALLGALGQGQAGRDSLLSIIIFPLLVPLLLAGIRLGGGLLAGEVGQMDWSSWMGLVGAFDAVFTGAALVLFPFVYAGH